MMVFYFALQMLFLNQANQFLLALTMNVFQLLSQNGL